MGFLDSLFGVFGVLSDSQMKDLEKKWAEEDAEFDRLEQENEALLKELEEKRKGTRRRTRGHGRR